MAPAKYIMLIAAMGAVTYLPRFLPIAFLSRRKLPDQFVTWLDYVPAAILSALVAPSLFLAQGAVAYNRPDLLAAIPTFIFAWKTKSLGGTVVVGMGIYWFLTHNTTF